MVPNYLRISTFRLFLSLLIVPCLVLISCTKTDSFAPIADAPRIQQTLIDSFLQAGISGQKINGATGIIIKNGVVVYDNAFGFSDIASAKAMKRDQIFRIASMTKPIVAVAVMMLVEKGLIGLDDPISNYIPEFKKPQVLTSYFITTGSYSSVPAKNEITIRQLLNQTSGIGYPQIGSTMECAFYAKYGIPGGIGTTSSSLSEIIPKLAALPVFHEPGTKFLYGINFDVLGYLIEVVSGQPLHDYLVQNIFSPLGMLDTHFYLPAEKKDHLVTMYKYDGKSSILPYDSKYFIGGDPYAPLLDGSYQSGGAGLNSTAKDYAIFCRMLLNGGSDQGKTLLSANTIAEMTRNQIGNNTLWGDAKDPERYGLGFGLVVTPPATAYAPAAGSYFWGGMFGTSFWIDPTNDLIAVFMTNVWPARDRNLISNLKSVVYKAVE